MTWQATSPHKKVKKLENLEAGRGDFSQLQGQVKFSVLNGFEIEVGPCEKLTSLSKSCVA